MKRNVPVRSLVRLPLAVLWLALLAAACGGDADFDNAARANTAVAWDDYVRAHPDSPHAREARERLAALLEDQEWQRAHQDDTADAYQRYLRGYPQGAHAHDALVAIANLNLAPAPATETPAGASTGVPAATAQAAAGAITRPALAAATAPTAVAPAVAAPTKRHHAAEPAAQASPDESPKASAGFRVQLGAFGDGRAVAERVWHDLSARYPELARRTPLITAARAANGREIHRLQVAGLDRAGAESLCATLTAHKDPCILVPPSKGPTKPTG